ncbi:unnamed protein product [Macrosiphum euphorbiae]|uniref:CCHC-type domain-containing protein n=1 Tax=Macrosiphum euphorbiae TaxID=13131 RepID=A0AAV0Y052_9HEMI|nr:unnamed protein product [Macrosiphum euphorbiae]
MTGVIGSLAEFQMDGDWSIYQERMEQFFLVNTIPEERKVPLLITCIGEKTYKTLKDLCDPLMLSERPYKELCTILNRQFSPKVSVFRQREEFYNLRQNSNENVKDWYARIKNSATTCKFGKGLIDVLRDKFITGMRNGQIKDRLCEEEISKELNKIVELAMQKEVTMQSNVPVEVHKVKKWNISKDVKKKVRASEYGQIKNKKKPTDFSDNSKAAGQGKCFTCGLSNHTFSNCKYKTYKCKICNKIGHLAKMCKNKSKNHYVEVETESESVEMFQLKVGYQKSVEPYFVKIKIEEIYIDMELDSGAGRSIIPFKLYKKYWSKLKVIPSLIKLKTYN